MDLAQMQLPLDVIAIEKIIPHRYPFLLIDKVISMVEGKSIVAIKNVSISDPILQGHFPGQPIYPGVLMVEGIAQTAAVLGVASSKDKVEGVLLSSIDDARFRRVVDPGTTLRYEVTLDKRRGAFCWFTGHAYVEQEIAVSAKLSAMMKFHKEVHS